MSIIANDCASLLNKKNSLFSLIDKFRPGMILLQETKFKRKNSMRIPNYTVFEYVRKDSNGGGLLTAVHNSLEPMFVAEGEDVEVIVVEITLSGQWVW